jgi:hypothetical protein
MLRMCGGKLLRGRHWSEMEAMLYVLWEYGFLIPGLYGAYDL